MTVERGGPRYRSTLMVSSAHPGWVTDALALGADAVMLDLEDSVAPQDKAAARQDTVATIDRLRHETIGVLVRINGWETEYIVDDMLAVTRAGLDCLVLPKAASGAEVQALDLLLGALERGRGLPEGQIEILPVAETAAGLLFSHDLSMASARVKRFSGVVNTRRRSDPARSIDLQLGPEGIEWAAIGAHQLLGARAAGVSNIVGDIAVDIEDLDRVRHVAELSRVYGANGGVCIHPSHISILNDVYAEAGTAGDQA